ncbi:MAG: N-methyl-L-tryptophan oxidase [Chloroflexota bacterium]
MSAHSHPHVDAIVLGGGTMGSAAAWELGKRGRSAIVFEQFQHVHDRGAHSGDTRVFRHAYWESPDYVPLVRRADALWMDLEAESGKKILERCGIIEMAAPGVDGPGDSIACAIEYDIPHEVLAPAEIRARWPEIAVPDDWTAMYSPVAGFLRTVPALRAMMAGATANGVQLRAHEAVHDWGATDGGVWVESDAGRFTADRLYITAGPWVAKTLARLGLPLHVRRKTLWWLETADDAAFDPSRFPVWAAGTARGGFYGFPVIDEFGLKCADHLGGETTDPDTIDRTTTEEEAAYLIDEITAIFPKVRRTVTRSAVCMYAMTPDAHFIVDRMPGQPNVVIGGGFSGHGFKFAPAVGEALVELGENPAARPMPILAIGREVLAV